MGKNMKKLISLILTSGIAFGAHAASVPDEPHVQVTGVGEVWATPDKVTLNVSVNEHSKDVVAAKKAADDKLAAMILALKEQGVASKDIHASQLNVRSKTRYNRDTQTNEFDGYEVSRNLSIILRNIDSYAQTLQGLIQQGANQVGQSQFGLTNHDELFSQAQQKAFKDANAKANTYAEGFNARIEKVYSISAQQDYARPMPQVEAMMVRADSAGSAKVEDAYNIGEIKVTAKVNAVFLLED